ncbi:MAG: CAP domain-containing protein [Nitrospirota bacterium]
MKTYIFIGIMVFLCGCSGALHSPSWWDRSDHALVRNILEPVNEARTKGRTCGNTYYKPARPVVWNDKLGKASLNHSLDMAQNGFLSHKGSDKRNPGERLSKAGYRWVSYGENVGQGYRTPGDAVRAWLKSEMHCKNIMNPEFKEAGAAFVMNENLRRYWTLVLGRPKN